MAKRLDLTPDHSEEEIRAMENYKKGEISKYGDRGIKLITWGERDMPKCCPDCVFVVYLSGKGKECGHAYLSLEELEKILQESESR